MSAQHVAMVAFASSRLNDGRTPAQAYCDLVAIRPDRRRAAIAVCVAAGTPLEEAEQRMLAYDDIWSLMEAGDEAAVADVLAQHGYFDHEVVLDDAQNAIVSLLHQAMAAGGSPLPAAHGISVGRKLRTGQLRDAYLSLEEIGRRRWPTRQSFWSVMQQVGEAFGPADPEVVEAVRRCADRARST